MSFVLTVDQIDSRRQGDLVDPIIHRTRGDRRVVALHSNRRRRVPRASRRSTVGGDCHPDAHARRAVAHRIGHRAGRAAAAGRSAVGSRGRVHRRSIRGRSRQGRPEPSRGGVARDVDEEATDAQTVFRLVAALRSHRTDQGWQAIDLVQRGLNQQETAAPAGHHPASGQPAAADRPLVDRAGRGRDARPAARPCRSGGLAHERVRRDSARYLDRADRRQRGGLVDVRAGEQSRAGPDARCWSGSSPPRC